MTKVLLLAGVLLAPTPAMAAAQAGAALSDREVRKVRGAYVVTRIEPAK